MQTMVGRISSITNAFVTSLIPRIVPTPDEIEHALAILEMDSERMQCAYCGNVCTEWDHLRPLVLNLRPTGYISEIANLVPACGKCNQSKGNKGWRDWMLSNAQHSPTGRGVADVAQRIARLDAYEKWRTPTKIDFDAIINVEQWKKYWQMREEVIAELRKSQEVADEIHEVVKTIQLQQRNSADSKPAAADA
jgi:hypothetical protein